MWYLPATRTAATIRASSTSVRKTFTLVCVVCVRTIYQQQQHTHKKTIIFLCWLHCYIDTVWMYTWPYVCVCVFMMVYALRGTCALCGCYSRYGRVVSFRLPTRLCAVFGAFADPRNDLLIDCGACAECVFTLSRASSVTLAVVHACMCLWFVFLWQCLRESIVFFFCDRCR